MSSTSKNLHMQLALEDIGMFLTMSIVCVWRRVAEK